MTEPKLNITVEELARFILQRAFHGSLSLVPAVLRPHQAKSNWAEALRIARRMLASDALYEALTNTRTIVQAIKDSYEETLGESYPSEVLGQTDEALALADGREGGGMTITQDKSTARPMPDGPKVQCDNCGRTYPEGTLTRRDSATSGPAWDCPHCGELCFPVERVAE